MPQHILDEISKQYTIPIFDVTKNYCAESQKINAILQCVEDAVFTIDEMGFIDVCNNSAQCLTDLHKQKSNSQTALLHIADLFPNLDMDFPLQSGLRCTMCLASMTDSITFLGLKAWEKPRARSSWPRKPAVFRSLRAGAP